ncbi:hypothetical protein BgiBS90_001876, partial [Biomphalaria glabrata]
NLSIKDGASSLWIFQLTRVDWMAKKVPRMTSESFIIQLSVSCPLAVVYRPAIVLPVGLDGDGAYLF